MNGASSVLTRIERVLTLEEKQGWRNRGVIGGLQAMAERWANDARSEGLDERQITAIVELMRAYGVAEPIDRPDIAKALRRAAAPDFIATIESATIEDVGELIDEEEDLPPLEIPAGESEEIIVVEEPLDENAGLLAEPALSAQTDVEAPESEPASAPELPKIPPPEPTHKAQARVARQQPKPPRDPADLEKRVTILPGVGESTAEQLARLGVVKVIDLLWHLPHRYDDYSQMRTIAQLRPGEQATIIANLWDVRERKVGINRTVVQAILGDSTGTLHATWWNKWVIKQLKPGSTLRFSGKVGLYMGQKTLDNPVFEDIDEERVATGRLSPVYRLTEGLTNNRLRGLIYEALENYVHFVPDPLPESIRETYGLLDLPTALTQIHFPDSREQLEAARRRLAFEELFYIQLGVQQRRALLQQATAEPLPLGDEALAQFLETLPFAPTGAQRRVLEEIRNDLARKVPMTRLVQGDVGSGKTIVAAAAMWAAVVHGAQAALLAPTQILAEQHHRGISGLLGQLRRPDGEPIRVALLTGRVVGQAREETLAGLASGAIDVVMGTTALIQEGVEFSRLALVVVDEQHRFGVEQRGALRSKSDVQPHLLVMSATPIPRSLALTIYGDLDVSRIDELPPGRTPVKTKRFTPAERERLYSFIRREVEAGRQAYIVYPLVDESDKLDVGAAVEEHKRLQSEVFPDLNVGLLHGRLSGAEKDQVMRDFAEGRYQVLVSTTVIEVGIDVPNASVILIEDADRFGLAQLHQLRGRVGRGEHASYCALISRAQSPEARARLDILAETNDGFVLAEKDLELRGPGEFFGTRQSGLPELRIAHLTDSETILLAREAAQKLFAEDPTLERHPALRAQVERFWRGHGDVS
ncbi:ATP-dependent DNA helicase RecG [Caldilinea sp.]|uniref:ATP-dependent DNA helicase RecG n=1 Tax=Caldilinea sp. TaxID=2293560 RepID=UPI0021DDD7D7|nr:ATP-dependent DNA helicase RecG [Caldilinea sp.]GIV68098.1 MAG: ATP-dependent DNA helicase RecG [Caldilinea sp.]